MQTEAQINARHRQAAKRRQQVAQRQPATKPWRALLRGVRAVEHVQGGVAATDALGMLLTPDAGASEVVVSM